MTGNKKFIKFLLGLVIILFIGAYAGADLGNFNDYGSSGGWSDSSSGGGGGGSSWDSSSSYGDSGHTDPYFVLIVFAVIGIVVFSQFVMRKTGESVFGAHTTKNDFEYRGLPVIPDNTDEITAAIKEADPAFSAEKFLGWAKEVFITLQTAWAARDWEKVRPFEKEELYRQHELQIKEYIDKGIINILERINVNNAHLYKYKRGGEYEYLSVYMNIRMIDYMINEKTKAVLKGSPDKDCFLSYVLTFIRKKGVLTSSAKTINSIVACPKCGAPTHITSAGKCEYCGFIVTTGEYSWVLSDIEGVKPGVNFGRGGVITTDKKDE